MNLEAMIVMDKFCCYKSSVVIFTAIILLYNWCTNQQLLEQEVQFDVLGPFNNNFSVREELLSPLLQNQLIDLKKFNFSLNNFPCEQNKAGVLLLIIVSTNPKNVKNRVLIRETWGRTEDFVKMVFLIGETQDDKMKAEIINENNLYRDIVQGNFIDSYRNMTYKHVMGLKWFLQSCPNAKYIMKTDDDIVVNIENLLTFLVNELSPWGSRNLILCHVFEKSRVIRSFRSKWRVSSTEYSDQYYPPYCAGWVVIYSPDVVQELYNAAQNSKYFWIDDVHITGTLAQKLNIPRTPIGSLELSELQAEIIKTSPKTLKNRGLYMFGPPNMSLKLMKEFWSAIR